MSKDLDAFLHFFFLIGALTVWLVKLPVRRDSKYLYYIGWYLFATLIFDGLAAVIMLNSFLAKKLVSNLFLYHVLTPLQYTFILLIYADVVRHPLIKRVAIWSIPFFIAMSVFFSLTIQGITTYNSYSILTKHAITVIFVLIYFYELIVTTPYTKIYVQPIFWISIGFLFHSSLNILLEGVSNYLHTYGKSEYAGIYNLYSISNYFLFILIAIGFKVSHSKTEMHDRQFL